MGGGLFQNRVMMLFVALVVISATSNLGGKWVVEAQVHHVVGGDRGWDPNSDLISWSSGRVFRVGDQIWLTYSVAQGLVAELKSKEEYESCDMRNPIKMYTEGLHTIPLESEGIRYFVSTDLENCNSGLKLHVDVLPKTTPTTHSSSSTTTTATTKAFEAAPPTAPSASPPCYYAQNTVLMVMVMLCFTTMLLAH